MNETRIRYRTPDGLYHLWTQEQIDTYIEEAITANKTVDHTPFHERPDSPLEEARLTIEMLHNLLPYYGTSYKAIDQPTKDDLLQRIDRMSDPLKKMVQEIEVKP